MLGITSRLPDLRARQLRPASLVYIHPHQNVRRSFRPSRPQWRPRLLDLARPLAGPHATHRPSRRPARAHSHIHRPRNGAVRSGCQEWPQERERRQGCQLVQSRQFHRWPWQRSAPELAQGVRDIMRRSLPTVNNADACLVLSCTSRPMLVWTLSRLRTAPTRPVSTLFSVRQVWLRLTSTNALTKHSRSIRGSEPPPEPRPRLGQKRRRRAQQRSWCLLDCLNLVRVGRNMAFVCTVFILHRSHGFQPLLARKAKHVIISQFSSGRMVLCCTPVH